MVDNCGLSNILANFVPMFVYGDKEYKVVFSEQCWYGDYIPPRRSYHKRISIPVGWMEETRRPLYFQWFYSLNWFDETGEFEYCNYYYQFYDKWCDCIRTNPPKRERIFNDRTNRSVWTDIVCREFPILEKFICLPNRVKQTYDFHNDTVCEFLESIYQGQIVIEPKCCIIVPTTMSSKYR